MAEFKYFGTMVKNQNFLHEEIENKLNSGNAYHHPLKNLFLSSKISKRKN
jgi:hypothetical protein